MDLKESLLSLNNLSKPFFIFVGEDLVPKPPNEVEEAEPGYGRQLRDDALAALLALSHLPAALPALPLGAGRVLPLPLPRRTSPRIRTPAHLQLRAASSSYPALAGLLPHAASSCGGGGAAAGQD